MATLIEIYCGFVAMWSVAYALRAQRPLTAGIAVAIGVFALAFWQWLEDCSDYGCALAPPATITPLFPERPV